MTRISRQLWANAASGTLCNIGNVLILMVSYPLYLHYLGFDGLGLWSIVSVLLTFLQLASFGFAPAVTKFVAERLALNDNAGIQRCVSTAFWTTIILASVICFGVVLNRSYIIDFFNLGAARRAEACTLFLYVGLLSVYALGVQVVAAVVPGMGRADQANFRDLVCRALSLLCSAVLLAMGFGLGALLLGSALYYAALHLSSHWLIVKRFGVNIHHLSWNSEDFRALIRFGSGIAGSSVLGFLLHPLVKITLTRYAGVGSVPVFEIAHNGAMQVRGVIEAAVRALMPEVSRLVSEHGNVEAAQDLKSRALKYVSLIGAILYTILYITSESLLRIWLRSRYEIDIPVAFRVMLLASYASLLGVPSYYYLIGVGRTTAVFCSNLVQGLGNIAVLLCFILSGWAITPKVGCISILVGMLGSTIYLQLASRRCR